MRRREFLAGLGLAALPLPAATAEEALEVWWEDLAPKVAGEGAMLADLKAQDVLKQADLNNPWAIQPPSAMVTELDQKLVKIPGYLVPLAFDGFAMTEGLLVPYVGACIHVPPPPANQIVFIRVAEPYDETGLWDPVWATGRLEVRAVETELAEAGYFINDAELELYQF